MLVALAQINSTLGDFAGNRDKIVANVLRAKERRCDLVVFPELSLFGYAPNDLLERKSVVERQSKELNILSRQIPKGISVLIGCVSTVPHRASQLVEDLSSKPQFNSAALLQFGKKPKYVHKTRLATFDVFDESRHFQANPQTKPATDNFILIKGHRILVTVCEDIWGWDDKTNPLLKVPKTKVDLVVNLSASPYTKTKKRKRLKVIGQTARRFNAPVVYVNLVGAQDETLFDGRSMVVNEKGKCTLELVAFEEDFAVVDLAKKNPTRFEPAEEIEILRRALVTGIRDFAKKTGLKKVHLGLSGGVDSAVVACLAVDALGSQSVTAMTLPSFFNDPKSRETAENLSKNLGIRSLNMDIWPAYQSLMKVFEDSAGVSAFGLLNENLQARIRGLLLMAFSNKEGSLLLTTGNKSEYAAGYSTLYGDQCGGLAPLGDLLKREVYSLARYYNQENELIPSWIIDRPPSAELRPNQRDQDSLPPYEELDEAVVNIIEKRMPARTATEKWILETSYRNEFKRWQAPPILKISDHAFGRGRRMPIAHQAKD
ncbi:MAG: NAD+ synthase [Deltaproteobacteria bacterium]|nr:NAD+ synthase [Deltaproteobacteria bacterium]